MSIPRALLDCLNANKIPYEIMPHAKAFTAGMAAAAEHIARHQQAKVVMVSTKKGPAMAVLPADRKLNLRKLKSIVHEPVAITAAPGWAVASCP